MSLLRLAFAGAAAIALAACSGEAPEPEAEATEIPEALAEAPAIDPTVGDQIGTPMAERMAVLGVVNKRNNISREVEMKPGESRRLDDLILKLAACERSAPWEDPPETGAFVQVFVQERPDADSDSQWRRAFSGWLFKNSPGLNVVEHPIYDVWVKDCAMNFPGEEEAVSSSN